MERPNAASPTESLPDHSNVSSVSARQEAWAARRERLLAVVGYADTLVDAVAVVDRAYEEATILVRDAQRKADSIRHTAERDAKQLTASAREELARLQFQIAQLEAQRHLAEESQRHRELEVAALAEYPSEHAERDSRDDRAPAAALFNPADLEDLTILLRRAGAEREIGVKRAETHAFPLVVESRPLQRRIVVDRRARQGQWPRAGAAACVAVVTGAAIWWTLANPGERNALQTAVAKGPLQTQGVAHVAPSTEPRTRPSTSAAVALPSRQPEKLSVSLRAERPTWVRTASDGVFDRGGFMAVGTQRLISGDRDVEVRTGDGGALLVSVNGGAETPLGPNGVDAVKRFAAGAVAGASDAKAATTPPREHEPGPGSERTLVATTGTASAPAAPSRSVRDEIEAADAKWFNALYRRADALLGSLQAAEFEFVDQRKVADRPEPGVQIVRELRSLQVDTWADLAAASGVMVEHVGGGNPRDIMSVFAETWVKREGRWQLMGLRITTPSGTSTSR